MCRQPHCCYRHPCHARFYVCNSTLQKKQPNQSCHPDPRRNSSLGAKRKHLPRLRFAAIPLLRRARGCVSYFGIWNFRFGFLLFYNLPHRLLTILCNHLQKINPFGIISCINNCFSVNFITVNQLPNGIKHSRRPLSLGEG